MPSLPHARSRNRLLARLVVPATALLLVSSGAAADEPAPMLQDMQLMARIISFQDKPLSGPVRLCVVFDPNNQMSRRAAQQVVSLLRDGLSVGAIELGAVAIAQDALGTATDIGAILATPGINASLLRAALVRLHVPCLTLDRAQLGSQACMVAVQTEPAVSIILDQNNAEAAGVHFATAFRMMVKEQ